MTKTTIYRISNATSGMSLGLYEGRTEDEAIEAMWADAGAAPEDRDADDPDCEEATGDVARAAARAHELGERYELCSHTDPTAEGREGISIDEAEDIAAEDAGLIYLRRTPREYAADRSVTIQTRLSEAEREAWNVAADASGVSRSEWLRAVANAAVEAATVGIDDDLRGRIAALQSEASAHGDHKMAIIAGRALRGDRAAVATCERVMADAAAMGEDD